MSRPFEGDPPHETKPLASSSSTASDYASPQNGGRNKHPRSVMICLFLAAAVGIVFGQTFHHGFVNFDDSYCVFENPAIMHGLNRTAFIKAFTQPLNCNWIPLTALSHALDCQLYGLKPGPQHLTSVLFHTATAILLFLFLQNLTRTTWRSAFVAAVFAIHPLRVESVAWIAERKDVLSGVFFVLTLWAYVRYARQQEAENGNAPSCVCSPFYWLALALFTFGLMAKPMLVTLPFVLLLLDYWPLNRLASNAADVPRPGFHPWVRLCLEKIPFLLLSATACGISIVTQRKGEATDFGQDINFSARIWNALVTYAAYIRQMVCPVGLAAFYPHPGNHPVAWKIGLSALVLIIISVGAVMGRRRHPYLLMGWLWYLGMLVPVIGLLQVGDQSRADRYTYLPQIGLYIMIAWGAAEFCGEWRWRRVVSALAAGVILAGLMVGAYVQTTYWKNSISLWTRALACTVDNFVTEFSLGQALSMEGKSGEAIQHYQQSLKLRPNYVEARYGLGNELAGQGKLPEAIQEYQRALEIRPDYFAVENNLGRAFVNAGKLPEAIQHYERALQLRPNFTIARNNLGDALIRAGKTDQAIQQFQQTLKIDPNFADAQYNLGLALAGQGKLDEAVQHYERALQIKPGDADIHYTLGNVFLQQDKLALAAQQYEQTLRFKPNDADTHYNLGGALARLGKLTEAIEHFRVAVKFKPDDADAHNNLGLALANQGNLTEAAEHLQRAVQLTPDSISASYNLGLVLAKQGKPAEAIQQLQQALNLAMAQNQTAQAETIRNRLKSVQSLQPQAEKK